MSEKNDGGFVFPRAVTDISGTVQSIGGMSLRDWFAGQALIGLSTTVDTISAATIAYRYADVMLAERARQ